MPQPRNGAIDDSISAYLCSREGRRPSSAFTNERILEFYNALVDLVSGTDGLVRELMQIDGVWKLTAEREISDVVWVQGQGILIEFGDLLHLTSPYSPGDIHIDMDGRSLTTIRSGALYVCVPEENVTLPGHYGSNGVPRSQYITRTYTTITPTDH